MYQLDSFVLGCLERLNAAPATATASATPPTAPPRAIESTAAASVSTAAPAPANPRWACVQAAMQEFDKLVSEKKAPCSCRAWVCQRVRDGGHRLLTPSECDALKLSRQQPRRR
jgi:hypothetical protein